ncbi:MAG TPA: SGNH/GDSL hydrolase family protein [Polyangiaceae bacterium]|jgi:lysophospholipase L1-like esterase|nr:SGNH/GDSL hydrolase family protein [Polyangiaceae bacterium]
MRTVVLSLASACWLAASLSLVHCGGDSSQGSSGGSGSGSGTTGGTGNTGGSTGNTGGSTGATGGSTGSTGSAGSSSGTGTGSTGSSGATTGTTGSTGSTAGATGGSGSAAGSTGSSGTSGSVNDAGAGDASKGTPDSGGGSTGEGGVSPASFQPCPMDGGVCKILPLGDSITFGLDSTTGGGYRVELFTDAIMNNKNITFEGSQTSGPAMVDGKPFPTANEGHSGYTIEQISAMEVPMPALNSNPNIILLMIGTNDMYGADNSTPAGAPAALTKLLDTLLMDAPNALLVVSTITPLPYMNGQYETDVTTYNATIQPMVMTRAAAGKHIIFVDQFTGFNAMTMIDTADNIHPNDSGYKLMGDVWYAAISPYLP